MRSLWKSIQVTANLFLVLGVAMTVAVNADEAQSNLRNDLGITYAKEGHFEDALRSFSLVLAENPDHAAALNNSANIYFVQGETARAHKLYERAVAVDSQQGGIYLNLGILQHSIGEDEASAASVRQGLDLIGDPHEAYYMLGLSQQAPTDNDRAADASDLKSSEIEALLARAMADIPNAAKESKTAPNTPSLSATSQQAQKVATPSNAATVSTRPGGAKASESGAETSEVVVAERLFWMSATKSQ